MNSLHRTLTVTAATLGSAAALNTVQVSVSVSQLAAEIDRQEDHIAAIDLGERLMRGESIRIFDLRSLNEFEISHIPKATQCDLASLASMSLPHSDTIVVYSAGGAHAAQAWMVLRIRGYRKVHFLREGLYDGSHLYWIHD